MTEELQSIGLCIMFTSSAHEPIPANTMRLKSVHIHSSEALQVTYTIEVIAFGVVVLDKPNQILPWLGTFCSISAPSVIRSLATL